MADDPGDRNGGSAGEGRAPAFRIRVKPRRQTVKSSKLPGPVDADYQPDLMVVYIHENTFDALKRYAQSVLAYELGGVLLGEIGRSGRRKWVEITQFIPAGKGISNRASFAFTNEAQEEIHRIKEEQYPQEKIVGWFHTHPGYGAFLSPADDFVDAFYSQPYHVAMVLDPTKKPEIEIKTFVWNPSGQRESIRRLQIL